MPQAHLALWAAFLDIADEDRAANGVEGLVTNVSWSGHEDQPWVMATAPGRAASDWVRSLS